MFGPSKIMKCFDRHLQNVRRSRRKTLAHMVAAAMKMKGVGVLALARARDGRALAKHRIKRGDRFLLNEKLETFDSSKKLFNILRGQDRTPSFSWIGRAVTLMNSCFFPCPATDAPCPFTKTRPKRSSDQIGFSAPLNKETFRFKYFWSTHH